MLGVAPMSKSRQVPRSPNCNVLDLGANRSIGQAVSNSPKRTIGELHTVVMSAWKALGPLKIERLFAMVTLNAKVYAKSEGKRMKNPSVGLRSAQRKGRLWETVDKWQPSRDFLRGLAPL
jgi:hypothetical protein